VLYVLQRELLRAPLAVAQRAPPLLPRLLRLRLRFFFLPLLRRRLLRRSLLAS
jgi:hypothetical protein